MIRLLTLVARHGKLALVVGLLAGLLLPNVALSMRPWLPHLVAGLLFLTAFRIGPKTTVGSLSDMRRTLGTVLIFQLVMPLIALTVFHVLGVSHLAFPTAVVLMLSASSVSGGANFAILLGYDPAPALRILVVGTALLPLTVLPALWAAPALGPATAVLLASLKLLAVITGAVCAAFALRHWLMPAISEASISMIDGITVITLGVIVVGLMSALGPALRDDPATALTWLAAVIALNFGLQIACYVVLQKRGSRPDAVPISIIAGNRNIALFLVALPPETTGPLLIFIGCYQIPMYLTPIVMRYVYGQKSA